MDMDDSTFSLRCIFDQQFLDFCAEGWLCGFRCEIWRIINEHGDQDQVGEIKGWILPTYVGSEQMDMVEAADAVSQGIFNGVIALVDCATDDFYEDLNIDLIGDGIFGISSIALLPEFRDCGLELFAAWHLMQRYARGYAVTVMPVIPDQDPVLGFGGGSDDDSDSRWVCHLLELNDPADAGFAKLGFLPLPRDDAYLYLDMSKIGPCPQVRKRKISKSVPQTPKSKE